MTAFREPQSENCTPGVQPFPLRNDPDVLVVGAGPSGCVAALAHAQRGARVLLLEADPKITQRLAGEWLHPSAVRILRRLGINPLPGSGTHPAGRGFVVFPDDDAGPIVLNYANGDQGLSCHHTELVTTLRSAAIAHPGIHFVSGFPVVGINGQRVTLRSDGHTGAASVQADLIVGADGRASVAHRFLGLADERTLVSYMAGLVLEDAELPFEGFGHVFLGGAGPIFVCRIGPQHIRVCLDVPASMRLAVTSPEALWTAYGSALPVELRGSFRQTLLENKVKCAANQWQPRVRYGRKGLALVGDAVGHFHPLTAVGLTLALGDGYYLAECQSVADYRRRRAADSYVPELLASSLYQMFTLKDAGTLALRSAVFAAWRDSPAERLIGMRLLACDETSDSHFHHMLFNAMTSALWQTVRHQALAGRWRNTAATLRGLGSWLRRFALPNTAGSFACPRPVFQNV